MRFSKPVMKWIISVGELALWLGVIAFVVVMLSNMHTPVSFQDYALIILGTIFGVGLAIYLFLLWLADFPPNENSLINRVYDPNRDHALSWNGRLALRIGDLIREDKRLLSQVEKAAELPENAPLLKEVMRKANKETNRRQREILFRYALMTLDSRDAALIRAKQQTRKKESKK